MSVIEDLKDAKATIEKGWHQGSLTGEAGVCAVGALNMTCTGTLFGAGYNDWKRRDEAYDALKKHLPEEFRELADFNDDPTTSKQDVLNLFDKALADLGGLGD